MELIDKAAVVAEIENRIKETESMQPKFDQFWAGQISAFKGVLKILDTLEVKEISPTDAFIKKATNFLNYKLFDVVATRAPFTIIPHHVAKQELIEDFVKIMKGE